MATWLPSLHLLTGDIEIDTASLYMVFSKDFVKGNPTLEGLNISWDKNRDLGSIYDKGFIHLITRHSEIAGDRRFDDFRAERLPWCRPMLGNCSCSSILKWDYKEAGRINTYLWLQDEQYVIVLERKKKGYFVLITGHHIDGPSKERSLLIKYKKRV